VGFDQYNEPPNELPEETRTFARLCASLTEEAEAIRWYQQRLAAVEDAAEGTVGNMSHLLREHPPISEAAWRVVEDKARSRLTPALAARKLVDFAARMAGSTRPRTARGRPG
jgi:hypothetical protein